MHSPGVVDALGRLGALEAVFAEEHAWLVGMRVAWSETASCSLTRTETATGGP